MACLPVHGKLSIVPGDPSALMVIGLIQCRPQSAAKNWPSSERGNLVVDGLFSS